ncbi:MAG: enoyl-CoA hydratase [Acidobacteria bacterium]|nr:MAG: enoyl-CoA hydratase [Acidobacteriota bacterium]
MDAGQYQNLQVSVEEGIAVVQISRPEVLNALNARLLDELESAFQALGQDDAVRVVIVTGASEKAFVAGADIKELSRLEGLAGRAHSLRGQKVFNTIESCTKPVLAAVNGYCLGGGCELALACHMRIASEKARFGQPEVKLGLIPGYGGTQRLPRLVGTGRAIEILLTGDVVEAKEAERIGLVNRVVPAGELLDYCRQLAKKIMANGPLATGLALQSVYSGAGLPLEQALEIEAGLFGLACGTDQMTEGTRAFLEKRKPEFK